MKTIDQIRNDFPILSREVNGKPLVYLDNGATTQKPQVVIDAISKYYEFENSNIHRGVHTLSQEATEAYEQARVKVQQFLNAKPKELSNYKQVHLQVLNQMLSLLVKELLEQYYLKTTEQSF